MSHPARVRGLKPEMADWVSSSGCRTPRGCVDWNLSRAQSTAPLQIVAFHPGAWIET